MIAFFVIVGTWLLMLGFGYAGWYWRERVLPSLTWVMQGQGKSVYYFISAMFAVPPPTETTTSYGGSSYYLTTSARRIEAITYAKEWMALNGFLTSDYVQGQNDCNRYAAVMAMLANIYLRDTYGDEIGNNELPFGVLWYYVGADTDCGHAIVQCLMADGSTAYSNCYIESDTDMTLTAEELASVYHSSFE